MIFFKTFWVMVLGNALVLAILMTDNYGSQLSSRPASNWIERLERPERINELKMNQVLAHLKIKPGDIVADIGAGTGVFSRPLAQAIAPSGKLLAVEIDQELLDYISQRAKKENIQNIEEVLGSFDDPNLPKKDVDLAFIHDVLHHIKNREAYLKRLTSYLAPGGRVAIIDFDKNHPDSAHQNKPELQITLEQVKGWMSVAGFKISKEIVLFEEKFFVVFSKIH